MKEEVLNSVLLVCADEARAVRWVDRLYAAGCSVIGPAPTASVALTLAMHTAPSAAVLVGPTAGRRSALELADDLERLWSVPSYQPAEGQSVGGLPIERLAPTPPPRGPRWASGGTA